MSFVSPPPQCFLEWSWGKHWGSRFQSSSAYWLYFWLHLHFETALQRRPWYSETCIKRTLDIVLRAVFDPTLYYKRFNLIAKIAEPFKGRHPVLSGHHWGFQGCLLNTGLTALKFPSAAFVLLFRPLLGYNHQCPRKENCKENTNEMNFKGKMFGNICMYLFSSWNSLQSCAPD